MEGKTKQYRQQLLKNRLGACFMIALLILLTGMNFLIYGNDAGNQAGIVWNGSDEDHSNSNSNTNPAGPDEKPSSNPVSFNEEYVHETTHLTDPFWSNFSFRYRIAEASRLHRVHFEIISPPPDLV